LNTAIWLAFAIFRFTFWERTLPGNERLELFITAMMVANGVGMLFCGIAIGWRKKWIYLAAVLYLLANIVLTITDDFSIYDLIILVIDLVLIGFLIGIRKEYSLINTISEK
jgi:hypothetical protein